MVVAPAANGAATSSGPEVEQGSDSCAAFHHVQMFARALRPLHEYKALEARLNTLASRGHFDPFSGGMRFLEEHAHHARVQEGAKIWESICGTENPAFASSRQDIVEQLIVGLGWRITAEHTGKHSRTVLVTSSDPCGVKLCVTAPLDVGEAHVEHGIDEDEPYVHFRASFVKRFFEAHNSRQSIGVLGFEVPHGELTRIHERYAQLHPQLLIADIATYIDSRVIERGTGTRSSLEIGRMSILEVYAYYKEDARGVEPDCGTVLRFVERQGSFASSPGFANPEGVMPGLRDADAHFDGTSIPAYSDHWVSNVVDRVRFLSTMQDTLGFVPKVEFNAGVIAAGAARIESTVIGNSSQTVASESEVLKSQSQVYLPINNDLSQHGHVAAFLEQFGQGVQHLASRVQDLISFVERVNNYRNMTGRGFSFLSIPRSYYGVLTHEQLTRAGDACRECAYSSLPSAAASEAMHALEIAGVISTMGVVNLDVTSDEIADAVVVAAGKLPAEYAQVLQQRKAEVIEVVKRARYVNLYDLLGNKIDASLYLQIVRNQVLVDIQGGDVLLQIFTCKILQDEQSHEAPFLEFIQRVCDQCRDGDCTQNGAPTALKPGCGGFGIRNFLTLFLSIELSKAIADQVAASQRGDSAASALAGRRALLLNQQLDQSNPILTSIADTMTAEARALEAGNLVEAVKLLETLSRRKHDLTLQLQHLSEKFSAMTAQLS